jgi:hypothetical protein
MCVLYDSLCLSSKFSSYKVLIRLSESSIYTNRMLKRCLYLWRQKVNRWQNLMAVGGILAFKNHHRRMRKITRRVVVQR